MGRKVSISKQQRNDRITLYDNLLLLASGGAVGEGKNGILVLSNLPRAPAYIKLWDPNKTESDFAPGRIYKYLLNQIHENDDIVFKYYIITMTSKKNCNRKHSGWYNPQRGIQCTWSIPLSIYCAESTTNRMKKKLLDEAKNKFKESTIHCSQFN